MRIIGVIDLLGGRAVHAQGGCRLGYRPVERVAGRPIEGDAVALASAYVQHLGIRELYVADLDAIGRGREQEEVVRRVAAIGAPLWLDAGVSTVPQVRRAVVRGATRVIVGLETLTSFTALGDICRAVHAGDIAFSLDLRGGKPIAANDSLRKLTPAALAQRAVDAGAGAVILLDLDRVGAGGGLDLELLRGVREAIPGAPLLAGGGVRGADDLQALTDVGCDAALVATALHHGSLDPHAYVTR